MLSQSTMARTTTTPLPQRTEIPRRRISAFIYGNILVLSALVALSPASLKGAKGFAYVVGVAISTFIAHVASDLIAYLLRHPDGEGLGIEMAHELRDAVPIATSALLPTPILVATWVGWLQPELAWSAAIGITLFRLSLLGPIAAWNAREPFSLWPLFAGGLLALLIAGVALLKALLTH